MKKKLLIFLVFISAFVIILADQIEDNKKKIQQLDSQINKNKQKINHNAGEINKAKASEKITVNQINEIETNIKRLESEYDEAESNYRSVLKEIGQNDAQIQKSIEQINVRSEIISVSKDDLYRKIRIWDKIRKEREIGSLFTGSSLAEQSRRKHDLKILFSKQASYIKVIQLEKSGVESQKQQEEAIKSQNQAEAAKIQNARERLEAKNKELNIAKETKNELIAQLRSKQKSLSTENNKISTNNQKLAGEKRKLEAQIQAIIAKAIREREIAKQKAEEEKRRRAEEERQRKQQEAAGNSGERNSGELAGAKPKPKTQIQTQAKPIEHKAEIYEAPKGTGSLIMPINGSVVLSYGQEKVAGLKSNGIEIRGSIGQLVKAADSGIVIYAGSLNNLGSVVIIDHGSLVTVYGNLAGVSVSKGTKVTKGQSIGTLGRDSISREPNLYFETRKGVNVVNPMSYL